MMTGASSPPRLLLLATLIALFLQPHQCFILTRTNNDFKITRLQSANKQKGDNSKGGGGSKDVEMERAMKTLQEMASKKELKKKVFMERRQNDKKLSQVNNNRFDKFTKRVTEPTSTRQNQAGKKTSAGSSNSKSLVQKYEIRDDDAMDSMNNYLDVDINNDSNKQGAGRVGKNYAIKSILGKSLINCRDFKVDGLKTYDFLGSFTSAISVPTYPLPEIAFIGRSNVGKSSLLNCLTGLNKKIAVESKTPGRTQAINLFKCSDKEGDICVFVDLPGYGFAKMSKDQQAGIGVFLSGYLEERGPLKLVILLVDVRREPQDYDLDMAEYLFNEGIPFVIVATKSDKITQKDELIKQLAVLQNAFNLQAMPLPFSSITGDGRKLLWNVIRESILDISDGDNADGGGDDSDDDDDDDNN